MFGIHDFGLFLAAAILLNLTPGPDTVYILGRTIAQGREAGIASALGISLGSIFHTCAAALGLSAILATSAAAFRQGVLTNILNPKVALFFLAFLPQFIDPASGTKVLAFLFLGLTFVTTGTIWCFNLAWFASAFSERLRANETAAQWLNRTAGALFLFLGVRLATVKQ